MRIAVITRRFFRAGGGAETYAVALVRELSQRHEVHVFSQQTDEPVANAHYHALRFWRERPRWLNQWVFALSSWWQTRHGFDVVHSHENTWHGQVQTIHVRPLRLNLFGGRTGWRLALRWFKVCWSPRLLTYLFLEGSRFRSAPDRHVVAASSLLRDDCAKAYPQSKVTVVTPGVDGPSKIMNRNAARAALGLPDAYSFLLFVANDYARKGLDTLLQAMAYLPADVHLAVVGDQKQKPQFEVCIESLTLQGRVHFLGTLPDVSIAYQAVDALAHPTLEDSYAMVVLEAMAYGLPVMVSGFPWCGIAADLVDGEHAMLWSDPRDAHALSQTIEKVLSDTALQHSLKEAGAAFARAHDWQRAALEYEKIYELARTFD